MDTEFEPKDRRGSERTIALFRPGLVQTSEYQSFCLIRNISPTGLMAIIHAPLERGAAVSIRISEAELIVGQVAWQKGDQTGIEFANEVDVEALLSRVGQSGTERNRYRSPRLKLEESAQFIVNGVASLLKIRDISQRGLKASMDGAKTDDEGTLVIPGLQPRRAVVRWTAEGVAGFYFIEPIPFTELGQWVLARHERDQECISA